MPTSYTSNLRLALPVTGELSGTWGDVVNASITTLLDDAVGGYVAVTISPTANTQALTANNGITDEARNAVLKLNAGTVAAAFELYAPPSERTYVVWNNTGYTCTFYVATIAGGVVAAGTGISIPTGKKMLVYLDGINALEQLNYIPSLTLGAALPVASGGTGVTTSTGTGNTVLSNSPTLVTPALGTPASGVATNLTGLPLTTGVTGTLAATNGGTGYASYAVGDLLYASTTTALSKLADVATGNALISGGVSTAPSWGKIGLTTHVSGTLPTANGGTNLTSFTSGGAVYASSTTDLTTGTLPVASGGTGVTTSTGTGSVVLGTTPSVSNLLLTTAREFVTVSATAATGTVTFSALTQAVLYYTTNASGNWTLNVRGDGSTTLNTMMDIGQTLNIVFLVTNGATSYYSTAFQIDGASVTPKWIGGAPTSGVINSINAYTYVIIKTAASTYTVLASVSYFV